MTTFPPPRPLPERINMALAKLRQARYDGSAAAITIAQRQFDKLVDELPTHPNSPRE
jgi:hypothetical protein